MNYAGLLIVSAVVGQGSLRVITNVAFADFVPTVPVISNVYSPGLQFTISIEQNWQLPVIGLNTPCEAPSEIAQRSVRSPAFTEHEQINLQTGGSTTYGVRVNYNFGACAVQQQSTGFVCYLDNTDSGSGQGSRNSISALETSLLTARYQANEAYTVQGLTPNKSKSSEQTLCSLLVQSQPMGLANGFTNTSIELSIEAVMKVESQTRSPHRL